MTYLYSPTQTEIPSFGTSVARGMMCSMMRSVILRREAVSVPPFASAAQVRGSIEQKGLS